MPRSFFQDLQSKLWTRRYLASHLKLLTVYINISWDIIVIILIKLDKALNVTCWSYVIQILQASNIISNKSCLFYLYFYKSDGSLQNSFTVNIPFEFIVFETVFVSQTILKRIIWPMPDSEDEDDHSSVEETCLVTGFLRDYIENGQIVNVISEKHRSEQCISPRAVVNYSH